MSIYRTDLPGYDDAAVRERSRVAAHRRGLGRRARIIGPSSRAHYGHYHEGLYTALFADFDPLAQAPTITARVVGPGQYEEVSRSTVTSHQWRSIPTRATCTPQEIMAASSTSGGHAGRSPAVRAAQHPQRARLHRHRHHVDADRGGGPRAATAVSGHADDGGPLTLFFNRQETAASYLVTNPPGAWRHYDALSFVVNRRYASGWSLQGSYTWGSTRGNFDNDAASNAGSSDLSPNGNFANPNRAIYSTRPDCLRSPSRREGVRHLGDAAVGDPSEWLVPIPQRRAVRADHELRSAHRLGRSRSTSSRWAPTSCRRRTAPTCAWTRRCALGGIRPRRGVPGHLQRQQPGRRLAGQQRVGVGVRPAAVVDARAPVPRRRTRAVLSSRVQERTDVESPLR